MSSKELRTKILLLLTTIRSSISSAHLLSLLGHRYKGDLLNVEEIFAKYLSVSTLDAESLKLPTKRNC
jgi:hypothetical protein